MRGSLYSSERWSLTQSPTCSFWMISRLFVHLSHARSLFPLGMGDPNSPASHDIEDDEEIEVELKNPDGTITTLKASRAKIW